VTHGPPLYRPGDATVQLATCIYAVYSQGENAFLHQREHATSATRLAALMGVGGSRSSTQNAMGPKSARPNASSSLSPAAPAHHVQLFDAPRSLADAVSHYLIEGRNQGEQLLVIARASHWQLIQAYLERRGFPVDASSDILTVIDARKLRSRLTRRGVLDPALVTETLGGMLAELSDVPRRVRVYGEVVELFAEEGNFEQACALEDYWNHLQKTHGFTLLCGYSAAHFADPRNSCHLRDVCERHTAVKSQPADALGTWLTTR
jgi:hypothetical protein